MLGGDQISVSSNVARHRACSRASCGPSAPRESASIAQYPRGFIGAHKAVVTAAVWRIAVVTATLCEHEAVATAANVVESGSHR